MSGHTDADAAVDPSLASPSRLQARLQAIPRALASTPHVFLLMALGLYLVVLPLVGVSVSAKAELIGGNYTNVASALGASIAAGGTLHLIRHARRSQRVDDERLRLTREIHELLHRVHADGASTADDREATT
jgi:hypothetical protein